MTYLYSKEVAIQCLGTLFIPMLRALGAFSAAALILLLALSFESMHQLEVGLTPSLLRDVSVDTSATMKEMVCRYPSRLTAWLNETFE